MGMIEAALLFNPFALASINHLIMVIVSNFKTVVNAEGEKFCMLQLTGKPELVKSRETGRQYFTARQVNVASTFSEDVCKGMIGQKMPGSIVKESCEAYDYTTPDGEVIELDYTWQYNPSERTQEEIVTVDTIL